jgi:serine protease Do
MDFLGNYMITDILMGGGDGCGAVYDPRSRLLGILMIRGGNFSLVMPTKLIRRLLLDTIKYGSLRRPRMGCTIDSMSLSVVSIQENSPAEKAGLCIGDELLRADGRPIDDIGDLKDLLLDKCPADQLRLTILRNEKQMNVSMLLDD